MISIANERASALSGYRFIDLFAGIGAFRQAFESFGAKCVFSSEWNKSCQDTYEENYGERPAGDITSIAEKDIPPHDILCGGFPCQAFSISGNQAGFKDIRGKLFHDVARIAKFHQPKLVFLENVKNLEGHDEGRTMNVIRSVLREIGYVPSHVVLNAGDFGVPQCRERTYIVCLRKDIAGGDETLPGKIFPLPLKPKKYLRDVLVPPDEAKDFVIDTSSMGLELLPMERLAAARPEMTPVRIGHIKKGRQGERIYSPLGHAITLSSGGGGIGARTGLYLVGSDVRRLTPRECARLTGFPDRFKMHKSTNQCYHQFGNSLVIDVVQAIISQMLDQDMLPA
jgi:DNA (cytosine-5)-methyltransferase 1